MEGTNPSRSYARIVHDEIGKDKDYALWTSDATQPYRLVDTDIKRVIRSVVVLFDRSTVIVVDRMEKYEKPSTLEARFFGYNLDGNCRQTIQAKDFLTERPGAVLRAHVYSNMPTQGVIAQLPIPEERAVQHPYVAMKTGSSKAVLMITAMAMGRTKDRLPSVAFELMTYSVNINVEGKIVRVGSDSISVA